MRRQTADEQDARAREIGEVLQTRPIDRRELAEIDVNSLAEAANRGEGPFEVGDAPRVEAADEQQTYGTGGIDPRQDPHNAPRSVRRPADGVDCRLAGIAYAVRHTANARGGSGQARRRIPRRIAMVTAWFRSDAPSFSRTFCTCILIVPLAVPSRPAISLLLRPCATRSRTSVSRSVSATCGRYSLSRSATSGDISRRPACTVVMAFTTSVCALSFSRYPRTPASSAR